MNTYDAVMIAEYEVEADQERWLEAWQYLVDTGTVWNLQGWFGRRAANMIAHGEIIDTHNVLGANPHAHS